MSKKYSISNESVSEYQLMIPTNDFNNVNLKKLSHKQFISYNDSLRVALLVAFKEKGNSNKNTYLLPFLNSPLSISVIVFLIFHFVNNKYQAHSEELLLRKA